MFTVYTLAIPRPPIICAVLVIQGQVRIRAKANFLCASGRWKRRPAHAHHLSVLQPSSARARASCQPCGCTIKEKERSGIVRRMVSFLSLAPGLELCIQLVASERCPLSSTTWFYARSDCRNDGPHHNYGSAIHAQELVRVLVLNWPECHGRGALVTINTRWQGCLAHVQLTQSCTLRGLGGGRDQGRYVRASPIPYPQPIPAPNRHEQQLRCGPY
jgi:hypothetical protein